MLVDRKARPVTLMGDKNSTLMGYSFGFREREPLNGERTCLGMQVSSGRWAADIP